MLKMIARMPTHKTPPFALDCHRAVQSERRCSFFISHRMLFRNQIVSFPPLDIGKRLFKSAVAKIFPGGILLRYMRSIEAIYAAVKVAPR